MKLYGYFRSSAAYRVRIALNLKGVAHEKSVLVPDPSTRGSVAVIPSMSGRK